MKEISERDFDKEVLECEQPVFACFTTQGCHDRCSARIFAEQLVKEYDRHAKFVRQDIKQDSIAVPTTLIFKNAKKANKLLNFQDRTTLKALLDSVT